MSVFSGVAMRLVPSGHFAHSSERECGRIWQDHHGVVCGRATTGELFLPERDTVKIPYGHKLLATKTVVSGTRVPTSWTPRIDDDADDGQATCLLGFSAVGEPGGGCS